MLFFTFCSLPFVLYIKILEITNFFIFKNIFIFLVQNIYSLKHGGVFMSEKNNKSNKNNKNNSKQNKERQNESNCK